MSCGIKTMYEDEEEASRKKDAEADKQWKAAISSLDKHAAYRLEEHFRKKFFKQMLEQNQHRSKSEFESKYGLKYGWDRE